MGNTPLAGVAFLCVAAAALAAADGVSTTERFITQYFYDQNGSDLTITDFKMLSAQRGIASGVISIRESNAVFGDYEKRTPLVLLTANGGKDWEQLRLKSEPRSLFFVDDTNGWYVAQNGIWKTAESGRQWKQVSNIKDLNQVYFLSATHGFAAGAKQRLLETADGGASWKPIPIAEDPAVPKDAINYNIIAFSGQEAGLVAGEIESAGDVREEIGWMDPHEASQHAQKHVNIYITTQDGGKTWHRSARAMYGVLTRAFFAQETGQHHSGLAILQFEQSYPWPSELFRLDLLNDHENKGVFRNHDRVISDVLQLPGGDSLLAGYQTHGDVHPSVIPGKLRIARSPDLSRWTEIPADYRAVALRVWLAAAGGDIWAATDTGMILKLEKR